MKVEDHYNDLRKGQDNYALFPRYTNGKVSEIWFDHYNADRMDNTNAFNREANDYMGGLFMRRGFSGAIANFDEEVLMPILTNGKGDNVTEQLSKEEMLDRIYDGKLGVKGFKVSKNATPEQIKEEYTKLIKEFVSTTHNQHLAGAENADVGRKEFMLGGLDFARDFVYSNENPNERIEVDDVLKALGLDKTKTADEIDPMSR